MEYILGAIHVGKQVHKEDCWEKKRIDLADKFLLLVTSRNVVLCDILHTLLGALKLVNIFFRKFAVHRGWFTPRSAVRGDAIIFPSARRDQ